MHTEPYDEQQHERQSPGRHGRPVREFFTARTLNAALPRWLCFSGGYRVRVEGSSDEDFRSLLADSYLLTRLRLGVSIKAVSWASVYAELQDATAFWRNPPLVPPFQGTWDLRRAQLTLGDLDQSPVTLRIGRQDLTFGSGRLIGTSYWRNASVGFDAALLVLNLPGVRANVCCLIAGHRVSQRDHAQARPGA